MYTSLILLVLLLIFIIIPLSQSIRKNLKMFLSFITSFLLTFLLKILCPKDGKHIFATLGNKVCGKLIKYFNSIPLSEEIARQHIRFALFFFLFLCFFFISLIIFNFIIKEKTPFEKDHGFNYHALKIVLKSFNIILIVALISFGIETFRPIWNFNDGFLFRYFESLESVVMSL